MASNVMKILYCILIIWPIVDANATVFHSGMGENDCKEKMIINVGDTVIWTNNQDQPRKVVSVDTSDKSDGRIQSEIIDPDESYVYRFTEAADYEYYCMKPHNKHGFIQVVNIENNLQEFDSSVIKYDTPVWFEKLLDWHDQKHIRTEDVLNTIKFLSENSL